MLSYRLCAHVRTQAPLDMLGPMTGPSQTQTFHNVAADAQAEHEVGLRSLHLGAQSADAHEGRNQNQNQSTRHPN